MNKDTTSRPTAQILPLQSLLRPALPTVVGNVDYQEFERNVERIDEILRLSGVERYFVELSLKGWEQQSQDRAPTAREQQRFQQESARALRCEVLRRVLGEGYRGMSRRLAECPLFRCFADLEVIGEVRVPSKSQLQRYSQWLPAEDMDRVVEKLIKAASEHDEVSDRNRVGLEKDLELDTVWVDTTCVKANIHFPVDWVLLRDATRSLMQATESIRRHGLKARMQEPGHFIGQMNRLCMAMSQAARVGQDTKKGRKRVLRQMKRLVGIVRRHAQSHRDLLDAAWEETDWTRPQAEQVLGRLDRILRQLPAAVKQAHERIIGERLVKNEEKILSLYEDKIHVIVRGKAGAAVEFGNTLLIAEQAQGVVVDWHLYEESAPADSRQLPGCVERIERRVGGEVLKAVGGDRGFDSQANREMLEEKEIFNGLCPRGVGELQRRRHGARFNQIQRRRAQTEGRIGILKNDFLGQPMRSKGYVSRQLGVVWSVLAHNLWVMARMERAEIPKQRLAIAA
jgi:hypothetical protein